MTTIDRTESVTEGEALLSIADDAKVRSFAFNRRPGAQNNRGRINSGQVGSGAPPVEDLLTDGGVTLSVGGVDLKNA